MNWEFIEAVFVQDLKFTRASRKEVFDALSHLEQELGLDGIKATKAIISNSSALGRMVEFSKCLKVADAVKSGNRLKRKLLSDYISEECQQAIAEALTAERLLTNGATVQYEPQLSGMTKRPDLVANWETQEVAFEVVFPSRSVRDVDEDRQQSNLLSKSAKLLASGTLNIYLTQSNIVPYTINSIVEAVSLLSNDTTRYARPRVAHSRYSLPCLRSGPSRIAYSGACGFVCGRGCLSLSYNRSGISQGKS